MARRWGHKDVKVCRIRQKTVAPLGAAFPSAALAATLSPDWGRMPVVPPRFSANGRGSGLVSGCASALF